MCLERRLYVYSGDVRDFSSRANVFMCRSCLMSEKSDEEKEESDEEKEESDERRMRRKV